jgi:hypothetical protein
VYVVVDVARHLVVCSQRHPADESASCVSLHLLIRTVENRRELRKRRGFGSATTVLRGRLVT